VSRLEITIDEDRTWFRPGDTVSGRVAWRLDDDGESLELRLFWFTRGRGTEDVEIVDQLTTNRPEAAGERQFRLSLPDGPCSFSGRLITLTWALEAVVSPGDLAARADLIVSPIAVEIDISRLRTW
jgi:hypothetical protein